MAIREKTALVQFLHPGCEARSQKSGITPWNQGPHRRKYIAIDGTAVRQGIPVRSKIGFWGEWEPPSRVSRIDDPISDGPTCIHEPFLDVPTDSPFWEWKNTDPFVFGGPFLYTLCQQRRVSMTKETSLRRLREGSVVLFGSCLGGSFCLDTVLVVRHWIDHDRRRPAKDSIELFSEHYLAASLSNVYGKAVSPDDFSTNKPSDKEPRFRLYVGATVDNPFDGMYSFFPCVDCDANPRGFSRPKITLCNKDGDQIISDRKTQGYVVYEPSSPTEMNDLWWGVREQVVAKGLVLGVGADLPAPAPL